MPKMKPHRGTKKRRHNFESKPSTRTRRLEGTTEVAKSDTSKVKKLLGL